MCINADDSNTGAADGMTEPPFQWGDLLLEFWGQAYEFRYEPKPGSAAPYTARRRDNGLKLAAGSPDELTRLVTDDYNASPVARDVTISDAVGKDLDHLRENSPFDWDWWFSGGSYHGQPPWSGSDTVRTADREAALGAAWHQENLMGEGRTKALDNAINRSRQ